MMRFFIILFALWSSAFAVNLQPTAVIEARGNVQDLLVHKNSLIIANDAGSIEVFDTNTHAKTFEILFGDIKDFMGDMMKPKIFSVDFDASSDAYLAVVQASNGSRELLHVKGKTHTKLINSSQKLYIAKAKFVDSNRVFLALLSHEVILFDITKQKEIYRFQVSLSHFSDFMLDEGKIQVITAGESGEIFVIYIDKGEVSSILKGGNVDNIYKVDITNGYALAAGQDRRGIIYNIANESYKRFDAPFLIYAGALSPRAKKAAFAINEKNDIAIFDVANSKALHLLVGQKSTLNSIVFQDEHTLFSGSDDKFIMKWSLP
ncbi:MAG: hypothetical protein IBX44_00525 [Sulfurospirillum sp.]|nr:hypothetical protein [Sulfurospirillum sp.]